MGEYTLAAGICSAISAMAATFVIADFASYFAKRYRERFIAETALERKVIECLNVTVSRPLWLQRVPMLLYAAASIAYGFAEKNLIHSLKTVFFVVWVLAAAWNFSNVKDEIKSRRKTH